MPMQAFTDNFEDNSAEAGFSLLLCDLCREGYKSKFIQSKTYGKGKNAWRLGKA